PRSEEQEAVVPVTREVEDTTPVPIAERRLWTNRGSRILKVRKGRKVKLHNDPRGKVVAQVRAKTDFGSPRTMAVLDRDGEWIQVSSAEAKDNRPLWVRASYKDFIFQTTPMKIMVNLGDREVRLIDGSKQVAKFPVTIGAGGTSTPPGRFGVTDVFTGGLNPAYGCCAIALSAHQPNLPPGWIGGDRVAIHGTTGPVGGAESSGCIRAANPNAMKLVNKVPLGTPVIVVS
ncbi:MAG: L,D-transpeptidase, partial [Solirubrobacterales bacterium]